MAAHRASRTKKFPLRDARRYTLPTHRRHESRGLTIRYRSHSAVAPATRTAS
ncbi:hypothetical protein BURMUCF2_A0339 [Burkholderia multivorans CF2]|nr:hypothetical protein BURMUCF2_A0339 [Burkholderia multivorans CF2]